MWKGGLWIVQYFSVLTTGEDWKLTRIKRICKTWLQINNFIVSILFRVGHYQNVHSFQNTTFLKNYWGAGKEVSDTKPEMKLYLSVREFVLSAQFSRLTDWKKRFSKPYNWRLNNHCQKDETWSLSNCIKYINKNNK